MRRARRSTPITYIVLFLILIIIIALSIFNTLGNGRSEESALHTPLKVEYVDFNTDSMTPSKKIFG